MQNPSEDVIYVEDGGEKPLILKHIWNAILDDAWMWGICWGQPRTGKTSLLMDMGYDVYQGDWDKVLNSIVFQLGVFLYKMDHGQPARVWTKNQLHNRVPFLILDDWGAQGNKAKTQHEPAWDLVKGAWDTYGTKLATAFATMNQPDELTLQLCNKYTHEIYVGEKGVAKYDKIDWQQNFNGWHARQGKNWLQTFKFENPPFDVYKQYDEMRMSLVDEMNVLILDTMAESDMGKILKRLQKSDILLLEEIQRQGVLTEYWIRKPENEKYKEALTRAKAHNLVVSARLKDHYVYDLTPFGFEVYQTVDKLKADPDELKKQLKSLKEDL